MTKYLFPVNLGGCEIIINDEAEDINFLYLKVDKTYILNFKNNTNKKMIKLSHKILNSKVKIFINDKEEKELNKTEQYYKLKGNFKSKIKLKIYEENSFIEFLSDIGNYTIIK